MPEPDRKTRLVRPLRNGQITIPAAFRKQLGITEATVLQVTVDGGELRIKPVRVAEAAPGSPWLKELYDLFAPVRQEAAKYSEEEINAVIDQAVAAVRAAYAERRL